MKLSTVFKVVTAVAAVCTVGTIAYKATTKKDNIEDVEPVDIDDMCDEVADSITPKQIVTAVVVSGACVLLSVPLITYMLYRSTLCSLTQKAINNGNLTFEELMRLANKTSQEVV